MAFSAHLKSGKWCLERKMIKISLAEMQGEDIMHNLLQNEDAACLRRLKSTSFIDIAFTFR